MMRDKPGGPQRPQGSTLQPSVLGHMPPSQSCQKTLVEVSEGHKESSGAIALALQQLDAVVTAELSCLTESIQKLQEENAKLRGQLFGSASASRQSSRGSITAEVASCCSTDDFSDQDPFQTPQQPLVKKRMPMLGPPVKPSVKGDKPIADESRHEHQIVDERHGDPRSIPNDEMEKDGGDSALACQTSVESEQHGGDSALARQGSQDSLDSQEARLTKLASAITLTAALTDVAASAQETEATSAQEGPKRAGRRLSSTKALFELLPIFGSEKAARSSTTVAKMGVSQTDKSFQAAVLLLNEQDPRHRKRTGCHKKMQPFIVSPTSPVSIVIDVTSVMIILYDCIAVPVLLLENTKTSNHDVIDFMFWASRIFWTLTIPRTFITGYMKKDGSIQKDPLSIARKYAKTWLVFDVVIVTTDWLEPKSVGAVRIIRLSKAARLARMFRVPNKIISQFNYANAERMLLWLSILRSMFTFLLLNHFLACVWYWVGTQTDYGWVSQTGLDDDTMLRKYTYSVHWSTSQFIGSTEVMPKSSAERAFGAFVMLFAFIWSASFISNITAAMTRLQLLSGHKAKQLSALQHFLANNGISGQLALRVLTSGKFLLKESERNQAEGDVKLLEMLSQPMRNEIHYEMHSGHLTQHPFFWHYNVHEPLALQKLCHSAVTLFKVASGDVLFAQGEQPTDPQMFFVLSGVLFYIKDFDGDGNVDPEEMAKVTVSMWVCEPVLWMKWTHVGNLRAAVYCSILALSSDKFRSIISEYVTTPYPARYAVELIKMMNRALVNDLMPELAVDDLLSGVDVQALTRQVFPHYLASTKKLFRKKSPFSRTFSNLRIK